MSDLAAAGGQARDSLTNAFVPTRRPKKNSDVVTFRKRTRSGQRNPEIADDLQEQTEPKAIAMGSQKQAPLPATIATGLDQLGAKSLALAERAAEPVAGTAAEWPDHLATAIEDWIDRQPPIVLARWSSIAGLLVSMLVMWRQGDTPVSRLIWLAAILLFLASWAYTPTLPRGNVRGVIAVVIVTFISALALRLAGIDHLALGIQGDEATTALTARQVIHDGAGDLFRARAFEIPAVGYLWFAPLIQLVSSPIEAVRATSAVAGAATVAMVAVWGWALSGPRLAIIAACLMATSHTSLYLSHLGTSNSVALFFGTATLGLATIAIVKRSWAAAAFTSVALVCAWYTWAGAREVLTAFALGAVVAWGGVRRVRALGPFALTAGGACMLIGGAALALGPQNLAAFAFPRSGSVLTSASTWEHAAQTAGVDSPMGILAVQLGRVMSAFEPDTLGDASPFYHFARPLVDPVTLSLAALACIGGLAVVRRQRAWLLPVALAVTAFVTAVVTTNPPDYPRMSMMLPGLALLAAAPLAWLSRRRRRGMVLAVGVTGAIALLNLSWFFFDYPAQGQGSFEHVIMLQLAEQGPVYVVTPGFYFRHETLVLLDPDHRIQPSPPEPDPNATWVAIGPDAQSQLAQLRLQLPGDTLQPFTDNTGRVVLYALSPPTRGFQ